MTHPQVTAHLVSPDPVLISRLHPLVRLADVNDGDDAPEHHPVVLILPHHVIDPSIDCQEDAPLVIHSRVCLSLIPNTPGSLSLTPDPSVDLSLIINSGCPLISVIL